MDIEDFKKYLEENPEYKEKYGRMTVDEIRQLVEYMKVAASIVESVLPIVREVMKQAYEMTKNIIRLYPNRRVVYLALCSKQKRTRKKNLHRIIKDMQKWGRVS